MKQRGNLSGKKRRASQINVDMLQALSFELIDKSVELWRTYQDTEKSKGIKIHTAKAIHDMVIDAMRYHPDIKRLRQLQATIEEIETELAAARKVHRITQPDPAT